MADVRLSTTALAMATAAFWHKIFNGKGSHLAQSVLPYPQRTSSRHGCLKNPSMYLVRRSGRQEMRCSTE